MCRHSKDSIVAQCHAVEVAMSRQVMSRHVMSRHIIKSHHINYRYTLDADATQPLVCQPEIP